MEEVEAVSGCLFGGALVDERLGLTVVWLDGCSHEGTNIHYAEVGLGR